MGASSSCCFCNAKAEESPCTENEGVAELNPRSPAEGASTSGRSEYYSERCVAMMRSRGQFSDDVAMEIEFSKSHWSEVSRIEVAPQSAEEEELNRQNREVLKQLVKDHPSLFQRDLHHCVLGPMIAKGGQAEIYEVVRNPYFVVKVFERGTSLQDLQQSWPLPVLNRIVCQQTEVRKVLNKIVFQSPKARKVYRFIEGAGMLEDGRFAFLMRRCWGDLRKLIDQAMQEKNVDGIQGSPFPYNGWEEAKGWNLHPIDFILWIAQQMQNLHQMGISHRDLKASNILLRINLKKFYHDFSNILIAIADFECSIGVSGTGFWRAPEILATLGNTSTITNEQWKKADVYSYGMTCFEIVTGQIPFDGELENTKINRQHVIEGKRPQLPSDLDDALKDLITKCWEPNPSLRPTFSEIVDMVETISRKQCQFRLFNIDDELPSQYHLATIEEVIDYPMAIRTVLGFGVANFANGVVDGRRYAYEHQLNIRSEKLRSVGHKLARLHH